MKFKRWYWYFWNDELKYVFDNRYEEIIHFFFHVCKYWEREEIYDFFEKDKKLQKAFIDNKKEIFNEKYNFYFERMWKFLEVWNHLLKMIWEDIIQELYKEDIERKRREFQEILDRLDEKLEKDRVWRFFRFFEVLELKKDEKKKLKIFVNQFKWKLFWWEYDDLIKKNQELILKYFDVNDNWEYEIKRTIQL